MTTLLQIHSSINNGNGQSSRLADHFVAAFRERNPHARFVKRDLVADPVPHLTGERFSAFIAKPEQLSAAQRATDHSAPLPILSRERQIPHIPMNKTG